MIWLKLLAFPILALLASCSEQTSEPQLVDRDGLHYQVDAQLPFTGTTLLHYKSGNLDFPGFARHLVALKCNSIGDGITLLNQAHDTKVLLVERKLAFARCVGKDFYLTEKGQMASSELEQLTDGLFRSTLQFSLIG